MSLTQQVIDGRRPVDDGRGMTTTTAPTSSYRPTRPADLLRLALRLDAGVTGLNGAAYLAGAAVLDGVLGLDATVLRWAGAFLLCYAAVVWVVGNRPAISGMAAGAVVAGFAALQCVALRRFSPA